MSLRKFRQTTGALFSRSRREFCIYYEHFLIIAAVWLALAVSAQEPQPGAGSSNVKTSTPNELELAIRKLRPAPGMRVELFAAEPALQNPVSFSFDEQGRVFVVETHRRRTSVYDIRNHPDWLDDDFSFRTVQDRSNFFQKVLVPGNTNLPPKVINDMNKDGKFDFHDLEVESERLRLLEDRNGDGVVEHATTFAENFKTIVSGVAAGVLARKGDVYFTCIPDLWRLRDTNGDGVADVRERLLTGFGVHISFGGHDLHGLRFGPDGKLYFSIADRGFNVVTGGKTISNPDSGAVLRCNPDGTELEVVATGLRNPQELAFDQFGNLWTGDNNGDGGDKARWVYVVEGSDSGWHIGWQHLPKMGPWNSERLWELAPANTAAYILPPVAHIGQGPAGLAFYPGTGMPPQYANHFFLCDFPGEVHSFALQPRGAGYEVVDLKPFLSEIYAVDVDFGPSGGAYVLDWVQGWEKTGKGRIWRLYDPGAAAQPILAETKTLLAQGFDGRTSADLAKFLGHPDMRVRLEAQFTLATRGAEATNVFGQVATKGEVELARLHSIWGLGQLAKSFPDAVGMLVSVLNDPSEEVRGQAAKVLGDARFAPAAEGLLKMVRDPIPRVRFFAAMALGKLGATEAAPAILQMITENADRDPFLRHAGVMALVWLNDMGTLETAARDNAASVRLAAALAMRKLKRPEVAMFLYDQKPHIVLEAARAIYDSPTPGTLSQLASLITKKELNDPTLRRAIHANYRIGKLENAMALSEFAAQVSMPLSLRIEAIELLGRWANPPKRDLLIGLYRPLPAREPRSASLSFRSELPALLKDNSIDVRIAAINAAVGLDISQIGPDLFSLLSQTNASVAMRLAAFKGLAALKDPKLKEAVALAAADPNEALRKEAAPLELKQAPPAKVEDMLLAKLEKGSIAEKKQALTQLATRQSPAVDATLIVWLDRLANGKAPRELELEIVDAVEKRKDPALKAQLARYNEKKKKGDVVAQNSEALFGGDAENGRKIFFERQDVSCIRCHKIKGEGGEVGPDLTGIGAKYAREYLLESIVAPNNRITTGYENLIITMKDGKSFVGLLKKDDLHEITINSPEDGILKLNKADIKTLDLGLSAMPQEIATVLSKKELRDVVEFLATQK